MPRLYAQVRKVNSPGFGLQITWLEAVTEDEGYGIKVACLDKVCGFVSLFQQTRESSPITSLVLECLVPEDSFELDPNSLPLNPDDLWYPSMAKVCSENMYERISYGKSDDDGEQDDIPIPRKRSQGKDGSTCKEGQKDALDSKDLTCGNVSNFHTNADNEKFKMKQMDTENEELMVRAFDRLLNCWEAISEVLSSHMTGFATFSMEMNEKSVALATQLEALIEEVRSGFKILTKGDSRLEARIQKLVQTLQMTEDWEDESKKSNKGKKKV
ncbi:Hypothetical predicted protein [Olea europaea subsp. europaea]|uniref:Uncharacterized protein n=1 Tax=Olea europaea subsp. europaea TaxID=158383 RepID=A0A8S0SGP6_OLEEU|nr:Hypothetical predicted protein [Olea europaea subsp. europaea]